MTIKSKHKKNPKILKILDSNNASQLKNICTQLEIPKILDILISSHENKVPTLGKIQNYLKYLFQTVTVNWEEIKKSLIPYLVKYILKILGVKNSSHTLRRSLSTSWWWTVLIPTRLISLGWTQLNWMNFALDLTWQVLPLAMSLPTDTRSWRGTRPTSTWPPTTRTGASSARP